MSPLTVRTSARSDEDSFTCTLPLTVPIVSDPALTPEAITLPLTDCRLASPWTTLRESMTSPDMLRSMRTRDSASPTTSPAIASTRTSPPTLVRRTLPCMFFNRVPCPPAAQSRSRCGRVGWTRFG